MSAVGGIVVRAGSCVGVSVNGGPSIPSTFSQVGVEIVPPDNTGDINNYLLFYISNNWQLVTALNVAGAPARAVTQRGIVKEAGNYPNISFGTANNTVFTDKNSELGCNRLGSGRRFSIKPTRSGPPQSIGLCRS